MTLKNQAISGVKWSTLSAIITTITQLAQLFILARFLSPSEFGLMAIIMIFIGFAQSFMDMGISNAIIHRQEISHQQLSSLYWLNIFSGIILSITFIVFAPLIVSFYNDPFLLAPLIWLSTFFVLAALGNQYRILCQKNLQFNLMAKVEITAAAAALIVSITFAVLGFGIYALVIATLVQAGISSLLFLWIGLKIHHRPALIYHHRELAGFYSFGFYQMGERSINYISSNIDKLLIGKLLGMQAVGFYNMAWQLIISPLNKVNPLVNKVAFPVYAKMQNNNLALNRYYSLTVRILGLITVPMLAFLSFHSEDVVLVIFGEGWQATATLVALLGIVGILKTLANPSGALILALGYAHLGFWWNLFWSVIIALTLFIALKLKPEVETVPLVLLGLSLSVGFIWHYLIAYFAKIQYIKIIMHSTKIILLCFAIAWLSKEAIVLLEITNAFLRLLSAGMICVLLYIPYLYLAENEIISLLLCTRQKTLSNHK